MLFYLIYFSKAKKLMQESDLVDLLDESRNWNQDHGLTGMLIYLEGRFLSRQEGRFMQVLEGTEEEVKYIFEKIKTDDRHHSVILLKQSPVAERNFASWTMGFKAMELEASKALPGYFDLDDDFIKSDELQQANLPLHFLKSFYEVNQQD